MCKPVLHEKMQEAFNIGIISNSEKMFLVRNYCKTSFFYHIPIAHKNPTCPPERPIIASMDGLTSRISQNVDNFLQPIVTSLPAYNRDSSHMLEGLQQYKWQIEYLWLSLDVCSLYKSIPHETGLKALNHFLCETDYIHLYQSRFICQCT